jgi:Cof subfamily protein (haloacid dehalogenase superfamily)
VFATARPLRNTKNLFDKITPHAAVCHCGAVVYIDNKPMFQNGIDFTVGQNVVNKIISDYPTSNYGIETEEIFYTNFDTKIYWNDVAHENIINLPQEKMYKIIIGLEEIKDINIIKKYLPQDLYVELMDDKIALIMNRNATKWNAIKELLRYYNIDKENVVAFGDDFVDIEMIEKCGIGVAVENGIEEIKVKAKYICDKNTEDGIAKWIEKNILR